MPSALYEVMRCAPSTRYFTEEPVPRELLHRVLDSVAGHISVGFRSDPWPKQLRRNPVEEFAFGERCGQRW